MSDAQANPPIDLIRWTFSIDPGRRAEVEGYLCDLGLDVTVRDGGQFVVLWEEPEGDIDAVVEGLWEAHGSPFEVTHEAFRRLDLAIYHDDQAADRKAA